MAGMLTALVGLVVTTAPPGSVDWTNIVSGTGITDKTGNIQTMPWTDVLTASVSVGFGSGSLYYVLNGGSPVTYSGPFAVSIGDTVQWGVQTKGGIIGSVTVNRAGPTFVDSFSVSMNP